VSHPEKWLAAISGLLVGAIGLLVLNLWVSLNASCLMSAMPMMPMMGSSSQAQYTTNGERIFITGGSGRGEAIPSSMMSGMGGCSMCHGADGHGGQMMGRAVPCNTFKCLSVDGYDASLIKRAVTQGIGADGHTLDLMMPRWQMSESDLNDVIAYLQTLP
jgi:cytochrome c oxidase subunit 2